MLRRTRLSLAVLLVFVGNAKAQPVTTYEPIGTEVASLVEGPYHGPGMIPPGRVPYVLPSPNFLDEQARALHDPHAPAPDSTVPLRTVLRGFPGLDRPSAGNLNPADTHVAKSSSRVLESVNSALRLFMPDSTVLATKDLLSFFGAFGSNGILFDAKIYFDRTGTNPRFYIVASQTNSGQAGSYASPQSRLWLAVSRSGNPSDLEPAGWCRYSLSTLRYYVDAGGKTVPTFSDFPNLGTGEDALLVSSNQASFLDPSVSGSKAEFAYAQLRVFNKLLLVDNSVACPVLPAATVFQPASVYGDREVSDLQSVRHYSYPSSYPMAQKPAYLLSTGRVVSQSNTLYKVWRVRNAASGSPALESVDVAGDFAFATPPSAIQPGSATLGYYLSTGPVRVLQAGGWGNSLWAAHTTLCSYGDLPNESCIRAVRIDVAANATNGSLTATMGYQKTFGGGSGIYYWMPSIAVDGSQNVVIAFLTSSSSTYESFAYTTKLSSATDFAPAEIVLAGNCTRPPVNSSNTQIRTGDYVGAQTNTDLLSFWIAGEAAMSINGTCQWGTNIVQITP